MQRAAGIILRSPQGRVLLLERVDGAGWGWPAGGFKDGEDAAKCAVRETTEETGFNAGFPGKLLMQRVADDGDGVVEFTTFLRDGVEEFQPRLNHEHRSFGWFDSVALFRSLKGDVPAAP